MKNLSERFTKLVCALTGGSILFSSCDGGTLLRGPIDDEVEFKHKNFAKNSSQSSFGFPVKDYISEEEAVLVEKLQNFAVDIFDNPELAREFDRDQLLVLSRYGISQMEVDNFSTEIQLIKATSDPEISSALSEGNLCLYLQLLSEKKLLQDTRLQQVHKSLLAKDHLVDPSKLPEIHESFVFGAAVIVVLYVAVATIAAVEVVGYFHIAIKTKFGGPPQPPRPGHPTGPPRRHQMMGSPALRLFVNKNPVLPIGGSDEYIEEIRRSLSKIGQVSDSEIDLTMNIINNMINQ